MKKLSDQTCLQRYKKPLPLTKYLLRITFSCYLFVLGSFVTFSV